MPRRQSIYVEGFGHANPIPAACRMGNTVMSGVILGYDPATGKPAATLEAQCGYMFDNVRRIVEAAGGTLDDIIKFTVWMADRNQRKALNTVWLQLFPDENTRPARHTLQADLSNGILVQCDFTALLE